MCRTCEVALKDEWFFDTSVLARLWEGCFAVQSMLVEKIRFCNGFVSTSQSPAKERFHCNDMYTYNFWRCHM